MCHSKIFKSNVEFSQRLTELMQGEYFAKWLHRALLRLHEIWGFSTYPIFQRAYDLIPLHQSYAGLIGSLNVRGAIEKREDKWWTTNIRWIYATIPHFTKEGIEAARAYSRTLKIRRDEIMSDPLVQLAIELGGSIEKKAG